MNKNIKEDDGDGGWKIEEHHLWIRRGRRWDLGQGSGGGD